MAEQTGPAVNATPSPLSVAEATARDHNIAGGSRDSLQVAALAPTGVDHAVGRLEEWLEALRRYRHAQKKQDLSRRAIQVLITVSGVWARPREWVSEVGLLCHEDSESALTLVVITATADAPVEQHVDACGFGLAVGGVLGLTVEPRLLKGAMADKPAGWLVAYTKRQNANAL